MAEEEEVVVVMVMTSSEMVFELFDGGPQHMRSNKVDSFFLVTLIDGGGRVYF